MKTIIIIFFIVHCTLVIDNCLSQWQPEIRLTNDPAFSFTALNNGWCVAASGNNVHTVWHDNRDGNYEIYYDRSTNGGLSWSTDARLTNDPAFSTVPVLCISLGASVTIHAVWQDNRDGDYEIYYKRSTNNGVSWGPDIRLTTSSGYSFNPSVTAIFAGGIATVHIAWADYRHGESEIYYKRSTDGGGTGGPDVRLTNNTAISIAATIAFSGLIGHISWHDFRHGNYEIYYKRSLDGGISWGTDTRLTNNTASSQFPSIAVSGMLVGLVWRDIRDGNTEIYTKRSIDGGINWGVDVRLTNNSAASENPSVAVSGSIIHAVWDDSRDAPNNEIYYKRSTDSGLNWGADTRLTNAAGTSVCPSVALSGNAVHIVWPDNRDGNYEVYYKINPTGNVVGVTNINSEIPKEFSLSQNFPNPFNPTTNFEFMIAKSGFVNLTIYDATGRVIATLVNGELKPGTYKADWDASNFVSGVYFYRLSAGEFLQTNKMVLIK